MLTTNTPFWFQNCKFEIQAVKLRGILDLVSVEAELLQIPSSMGWEGGFWFFSPFCAVPFVPSPVTEEIVPGRGHHPALTSNRNQTRTASTFSSSFLSFCSMGWIGNLKVEGYGMKTMVKALYDCCHQQHGCYPLGNLGFLRIHHWIQHLLVSTQPLAQLRSSVGRAANQAAVRRLQNILVRCRRLECSRSDTFSQQHSTEMLCRNILSKLLSTEVFK